MSFRGGRGGGGGGRGDMNRRGGMKNLMGAPANFLPEHMKALFRPREPLPFLPPLRPAPSRDEPARLDGVAELLGMVSARSARAPPRSVRLLGRLCAPWRPRPVTALSPPSTPIRALQLETGPPPPRHHDETPWQRHARVRAENAARNEQAKALALSRRECARSRRAPAARAHLACARHSSRSLARPPPFPPPLSPSLQARRRAPPPP